MGEWERRKNGGSEKEGGWARGCKDGEIMEYSTINYSKVQ